MGKNFKVKPEWKNKTLAEWLKMFPEDTPIKIYSYGVCDSLIPSIERFYEDVEQEEKNYFSDNRTRDISQAIVKRIFRNHEYLVFDVKGTTVHLWNQVLMENKDPNRDMMPGLRVPVKEGVDINALYNRQLKKWETQPFFMDDFAKSCLIHANCLEIL